ncbi:MAG: hypothetical protein MJZ38_00315 [archaeon]|nr:hypothetical protein [archaeon]
MNQNVTIYAVIAVTIVAVAGLSVATLTHHAPSHETIYPLGDISLQFDRDVGVGTVYVMTATGEDRLATYSDGQQQDSRTLSVTGTRTVEVIAADAGTYTYKVTTSLTEDGKETTRTSTYVVDRRTGEIIDNPDVSRVNNLMAPKPDIMDRWGPHPLDGSNWTVHSKGITFQLFVFVGKDDKVCYQINESFETGSKDEGHTESYTLEYLLYSMDFKKF